MYPDCFSSLRCLLLPALESIHSLVQVPLTLFRAEVIGHFCIMAKQCTPIIWQWSNKYDSRCMDTMDRPFYVYALILAPCLFLLTLLRLLQVIQQTHAGQRRPRPATIIQSPTHKQTCRLVAFLGSGGHTGEMIRLLNALDFAKFNHRTYLVSTGDNMSLSKARELEAVKSRGKQHGEGVSNSHPFLLLLSSQVTPVGHN